MRLFRMGFPVSEEESYEPSGALKELTHSDCKFSSAVIILIVSFIYLLVLNRRAVCYWLQLE